MDKQYKLTEEHRAKIGAAQKREKNHNYGKHPSEETRAKLREAHKNNSRVGENHPMWGKHLTPETKRKISLALKGRKCPWIAKRGATGKHRSPETKDKIAQALIGRKHTLEELAKMSLAKQGRKNPFYGRHHSEESKQKNKQNHRSYVGENHPLWGKSPSEETRRKISESNKGKVISKEARDKISKALKGKYVGEKHPMFGKHYSEEVRKKDSEISRQHWADPEFKKRILKSQIRASNRKPTKPEKMLTEMLNELLPNQYQYVGAKHEIVINACTPDFININGQKKVIEMFGDWYHSPRMTGKSREQEEIDKMNNYRAFGFDCLIIWENDIKKHKDEVAKRILSFHRQKHKKLELQPCLL